MPRDYDSYLYESLCQSGDEHAKPKQDESNVDVARRKSLTDGLPQLPILVEGSGISIKMKVRPHVRWTKVLAKWTGSFEDPNSAPMAWPVSVSLPDQNVTVQIKSIQESISRTLGPELIQVVADKDPALIVSVGVHVVEENEDVTQPVDTVADVPAPLDDPPLLETVENDMQLKDIPAAAVQQSTPSPTTYKLRIENQTSKIIKLSVSAGCLISRLTRKYIEALKQTSPDSMGTRLAIKGHSGEFLDSEKTVGELFGSLQMDNLVLEAITGSPKENPTPKTSRKNSIETSKKRRRNQELGDVAEQAEALAYWEQVNSVRKATRRSSSGNDEDEAEDDDDLALAIGLSLSST